MIKFTYSLLDAYQNDDETNVIEIYAVFHNKTTQFETQFNPSFNKQFAL